MPFKMVEQLDQASQDVGSALRENIAPVSARLASKWSHLGDQGKIADNVSGFMDLMDQHLVSDRLELLEDAATHRAQLDAEKELLSERDQAEVVLHAMYIKERDLYSLVYGRDNALAAGFEVETARTPKRLRTQVGRLLKRLARTQAPEVGGGELDSGRTICHERLAAAFQPHYDRLLKALRAISKWHKATTISLGAKQAALSRHVSDVLSMARISEALCSMAGMPEQAAGIRSSAGYASRIGTQG